MQTMQLTHFFLTASLLIALNAEAASQGLPPVHVFAQLEGTWQGSFVRYDEHGKELYRLRVKQVYRTINPATQKVEIEDFMPDGTKITGVGENTASRGLDGSWRLRCRVVKSNGDQEEHEGQIVKGPDGDEQILWCTNKPDRTELFRERVHKQGRATIYLIDGVGRYGGRLILMSGSYRRQ